MTKVICLGVFYFLLFQLQAMPPMFEKRNFPSEEQRYREARMPDFKQREEGEWRGDIDKEEIAEEETLDPACQEEELRSRLSFMDRITRPWSYLSSLLSRSTPLDSLSQEQKGDFQGVPIALADVQKSEPLLATTRMNTSGEEERTTSFIPEERKKDPARRIMFEPEEVSLEAPQEEEGKGPLSDAFPGQEEVALYSVELARIQQHLRKSLKAIAHSNPEIAAKKSLLREELKALRQDNDADENPKNIQRRKEIHGELKRLESLPEQDPVKLVRIAQFQEEAYFQTREVTLQMLQWLRENPECQQEAALLLLTQSLINMLEMGYKSVARHQLEPVLYTNNTVPYHQRHFEPPHRSTGLKGTEEYKLPAQELEAELTTCAVNYTLENVQGLKKLLNMLRTGAPPEEMGNELREFQIQQARRDWDVSSRKVDVACTKFAFWEHLPKEEQKESYEELKSLALKKCNDAYAISQTFHEILKQQRMAQPLTLLPEIKERAIAEGLMTLEKSFATADLFQKMLAARRKQL